MSKKSRYRWRQSRFWLWLLIYWLASTVGASIIHQLGGPTGAEAGWIITLMLVLASVCMATERGGWKAWQRILFLPVAWIGAALLTLVAIPLAALVYASGRIDLVDRFMTLVGTLPIVILAMRRSRLFVIPEREGLDPDNDEPAHV